jgi:hypothetical protein
MQVRGPLLEHLILVTGVLKAKQERDLYRSTPFTCQKKRLRRAGIEKGGCTACSSYRPRGWRHAAGSFPCVRYPPPCLWGPPWKPLGWVFQGGPLPTPSGALEGWAAKGLLF